MEGTSFVGHGEEDPHGDLTACTEEKASSGAQRKDSGNGNMLHREEF